jgi:hypothetical protein
VEAVGASRLPEYNRTTLLAAVEDDRTSPRLLGTHHRMRPHENKKRKANAEAIRILASILVTLSPLGWAFAIRFNCLANIVPGRCAGFSCAFLRFLKDRRNRPGPIISQNAILPLHSALDVLRCSVSHGPKILVLPQFALCLEPVVQLVARLPPALQVQLKRATLNLPRVRASGGWQLPPVFVLLIIHIHCPFICRAGMARRFDETTPRSMY